MTLTIEQRRAINKANASKSTGPTSETGKARSRANALRHGLRAEVVALPDEDRSAIAARAEAWNTYYQPESPAAQHLVNQCVHATLMADRCNRYHTAAVAAQISEVPLRWETSRQDKLDRLAAKFRSCPVKTVRKLGRTARGCRWMIERWTALADAFKTNPGWTDSQLDDAMRLLGYAPNSWRIEPEVYTLNLFNVLCYGEAMAHILPKILDAGQVPPELAGVYTPSSLPDAETCRRYIAGVVAEVLASLVETEAVLREKVENPDRASATDRAAILTNPAKAQLVLRYQAEARTLFHRSYTELVRTLKRDESGPYAVENTVIDTPAPAPVPIDEPVCDTLSTQSSDEASESVPPPPDPGAGANSQVVEEVSVAAISPNEAKSDTGRRVPGEIALR